MKRSSDVRFYTTSELSYLMHCVLLHELALNSLTCAHNNHLTSLPNLVGVQSIEYLEKKQCDESFLPGSERSEIEILKG